MDAPQPRRADQKLKLVVVGDGAVGKTCLLTVFAKGEFPEDYVPTVFETNTIHTTSPLDPSKTVELALWDTAGQEEFDRLRPLSYTDVSVILICFAVDYPTSLENIQEKWWPEVEHFCAGVPVLLVGTKIDLRKEQHTIDMLKAQGLKPISAEQARLVADKLGAQYAECSARDNVDVDTVFKQAMTAAIRKPHPSAGGGSNAKRRKRERCVIF